MTEFRFNCPYCDQHLEASPELLGQTIECPACKGKISIGEEEGLQSSMEQNSAAGPTTRVSCKKCKSLVLPATSQRTGGLCMPCYKEMKGNCDICNKTTTQEEMKRVKSGTMKVLTSLRFVPKSVKELGKAGAVLGLSSFDMWLNTVSVQHDDWGLCSDCHREVSRAVLRRVLILSIIMMVIIAIIIYKTS